MPKKQKAKIKQKNKCPENHQFLFKETLNFFFQIQKAQ